MKTIHIFGWGRLYPGHDMEESLRAQRLRAAQNDVLWGARPPPTECDFEGTHSKISAMGPEFLLLLTMI